MKMTSLLLSATLAIFAMTAVAPSAFAQDASAPAHAKKKKAVKRKTKKKSLLERVSDGSSAAPAKTTSKASQKASQTAKASDAGKGQRLSRDIVFDGSNVNGQYHSAGEAVAKVEQEKQLNELVGVRKDYRDRLMAERERLQRGEPVSAQQ